MTDAEIGRINLLHPDARAALMAWHAEVETRGYTISIGQTIRSREDQAALWKEGAKTANPVSWHELKRAWHFYLLDANGKRIVNAEKVVGDYLKCARLAEFVGCRQLGFNDDDSPRHIGKGKFWDPFHLEYRAPYATLAEACKAEAPTLLALLA